MINVVLYEPEIPENTGNIMRTCAGTNSYLHLIEPLGFVMDEKRIKRSGVNYIDKVHYQRYIDFDDFKNKNYYLIFGKESTGIPKEILHNNLDKCYRIPTSENIRALNLSNCVALITYEALRQQNFPNLLRSDPFKGEDYLKKEDGLNQ